MAVTEQLTSSSSTASVFLLTNANLQKWHVDRVNEQASVHLFCTQISRSFVYIFATLPCIVEYNDSSCADEL